VPVACDECPELAPVVDGGGGKEQGQGEAAPHQHPAHHLNKSTACFLQKI
jgi:hypothetical protein